MNRLKRIASVATSLRGRLAIGMLAITFSACIAFALAIHDFVDVLQDEILKQTLARELAELSVDYSHGVPIAGRRGQTGRVYVSRAPDDDPSLPQGLRQIGNGERHTFRYEGHVYYSGRRDAGPVAIYLMINVDDVKSLVRQVAMLGGVTLGVTIVLALLIALVFTWAILRPVRHLAARLTDYRPGQSNPPIAADYSDPDMRDIASSFDELIGRFDAVLAREKAFTEDASHELRTPLAVALNASELLSNMPGLGERARGRALRVQDACERIQRLVTALLFLARDRRSQCESLSDAAAVLDDVLVYHRDAILANRIELSIHARSTPILLPEGVIYSVLHNLIDNAIRHTVDGTLRVEVTPERIHVVDSGCGLPEQALARIFERQYRTATSPGLGIGLYLVSRICERQGWLIRATSEPGVGTSIDIQLKPDTLPASNNRPRKRSKA